MNKLKILLGLIILSIILSSINANSAIVLNRSSALINAYKNNNLVRLHVIANSNSPVDQYIKRTVRDEIIKFMADYSTNEELLADLDRVKEYIEGVLASNGVKYPVRVDYGDYYFPRRTYDDITLPAGEYRALKVVLGSGEGANWWCVLLPPLCVDNKPGEKQKIEFRLKLAEVLNRQTKTAFSYKLFNLNLGEEVAGRSLIFKF